MGIDAALNPRRRFLQTSANQNSASIGRERSCSLQAFQARNEANVVQRRGSLGLSQRSLLRLTHSLKGEWRPVSTTGTRVKSLGPDTKSAIAAMEPGHSDRKGCTTEPASMPQWGLLTKESGKVRGVSFRWGANARASRGYHLLCRQQPSHEPPPSSTQTHVGEANAAPSHPHPHSALDEVNVIEAKKDRRHRNFHRDPERATCGRELP